MCVNEPEHSHKVSSRKTCTFLTEVIWLLLISLYLCNYKSLQLYTWTVMVFQASLEIIITELQSCLCLCRAAIVYLKNPSDAKAAVEDLNGRSLQGHTVQVEQLCRPALAEPTLRDQPRSTSKTAGDGLRTKGVTYSLPHGVSMKCRHLRNFAVSRTIMFSVTGKVQAGYNLEIIYIYFTITLSFGNTR